MEHFEFTKCFANLNIFNPLVIGPLRRVGFYFWITMKNSHGCTIKQNICIFIRWIPPKICIISKKRQIQGYRKRKWLDMRLTKARCCFMLSLCENWNFSQTLSLADACCPNAAPNEKISPLWHQLSWWSCSLLWATGVPAVGGGADY